MRLLKSAKIPKDMLTYMKVPNIQNIIILTPNRILNFDEIYLDLSENKILWIETFAFEESISRRYLDIFLIASSIYIKFYKF